MSTVTESAAWTAKDRRHVWHQMSGHPRDDAPGPLVIASGDGAWVTDLDGNRYLDGLSGQWCVNVGYGRRRLAAGGRASSSSGSPSTRSRAATCRPSR